MRIKIALATAVAALVFTPATPAHAIPANCQAVPWGFLGSQVRAICDGPILPDGSWMRHRVIGVPAHTELSMPEYVPDLGAVERAHSSIKLCAASLFEPAVQV